MNLQYESAWQLHQFFSARQIPYAVIGGIAVQRWGRPRFTIDVDITVLCEIGQEKELATMLLKSFKARIPNALQFSMKHRVLLLSLSEGCDVDISFGLPGFESMVTSRVVDFDLGDGRKIKICSPEDLIIYKAVASRTQDIMDIDGIIKRQGQRLNIRYIRRWLKEFALLLENPDIHQQFEKLWSKWKNHIVSRRTMKLGNNETT